MAELPPASSALYADVIVPRHLRQPFTYTVPATLVTRIRVGSHVVVPFGAGRLHGIVMHLATEPPTIEGRRPSLRPIDRLVDEADLDVPLELLTLSRLVAERYLAPWGQCLRLILPPSVSEPEPKRKPARPPAPERAPMAIPQAGIALPAPWWTRLQQAIEQPRYDLLLAVGSAPARMAAIIRACNTVLACDRPAIIVAPEISRVEIMAAHARARWGEAVAVLHSGMTDRARLSGWRRIRRGEARVVVGTRSAVFAPFDDRHPVGLLCVDGEEDASLKEEQEPHYHARDVARLRAERLGLPVLLTSSHPSLEMMATLLPEAITELEGARPAPRPSVQLVDLREVPRDVLLAPVLVEALRSAIQRRAGAVLYLNRKGFASAVWCRDCGAAPTCAQCSVSLRLYQRVPRSPRHPAPAGAALSCPYCGLVAAVPDTCPACQSTRLQPVGFGTARLEEEVRRLFPRARVLRLDADVARQPKEAAHRWRAATVGAFDILIGTQMLLAGPPLPRVGVVGVPHADAGLHLPDFRSAERTYQTLSDVVSLCRPADEGGTVLLQTYLPHHHAIAAVAAGQPALFYEHEAALRQMVSYPPFASLINLTVSGRRPDTVQPAAQRWATLLRDAAAREADTSVLGPIPAPIARVRSRHRWQILVKGADAEAARRVVQPTLAAIEATSGRAIKFDVDVDPMELV